MLKIVVGIKAQLLVFTGVLLCSTLHGQTDTTQTVRYLDEVLIEAIKLEKGWLETPNSLYVSSPEHKGQFSQNGLSEYLLQTPSIFALNTNNKAQDLRIAIRGFGSRASFGVRGVKIIVDGIPETTTDGQGQLDNLNLGIIERIEVLNNGSASLYGNASGGVININTMDEAVFEERSEFLRLGSSVQSFSTQQHQLTVGKKLKKTSFILHGNYYEGEGYRAQAAFKSTNFNLRATHELSSSSKLTAIVNYMNSPQGDDPGGVDQTLYDSLPTAARDRNQLLNAGETVDQFKAALRYQTQFENQLDFSTYTFYSTRGFTGRVPVPSNGWIELERSFYGHGSTLSKAFDRKHTTWTTLIGYDLSMQSDDRERFGNLDGTKGDQVMFQEENFSNAGIYWINDLKIKDLTLNVALRYDFNRITMNDRLLSNGDDSGSINLNDFNYSMGAAYQIFAEQQLFLTHSTSFETPTLNELSNNPMGDGFNLDLKPQTARHFEAGLKGYFLQNSSYQVSIFRIDSKNEILPFETMEGADFFANAGETKRTGLELLLRHPVTEDLTLSTNWSFNRFVFDEFILDGENLSNNRLPGLPSFQGYLQLDYNFLSNFHLNLQNQVLGKIYVDNANSAAQTAKNITNVSLSYLLQTDGLKIFPYVGANNVFKTRYADNIRINAFGGRYYEAAPDLVVYGGLRIEL